MGQITLRKANENSLANKRKEKTQKSYSLLHTVWENLPNRVKKRNKKNRKEKKPTTHTHQMFKKFRERLDKNDKPTVFRHEKIVLIYL